MTDKNGQSLTWLDFMSQKTGKSVEELRAEMKNRGKLGGHPKGKKLSKEHRRKISEGLSVKKQ